MRAGKLRHRIQIRSETDDTQNKYGEVEDNWATAATVWGSIEPLIGRELFEAQQVQPRVSTRIRIRYRTHLTASDRLRHVMVDSAGAIAVVRTYNIEAVLNVEGRNRELELLCVGTE